MPVSRIANFSLCRRDMGPALIPGHARISVSSSVVSAMLLYLGLALGCQAALAGERSAKQWLEKMSAAMQELSYRGVFIYRRDTDLAAMKVTHIVDKHGAWELLETLTGEARREMRSTPVVAGDNPTVSQLGGIDRYYTLELLGSDRAAGHATKVISVMPRDEYRYGYRLWLDQSTGLLLKSDLLAQDGAILEQVMFTSLEVLGPDEVREISPTEESRAAQHPRRESSKQQAAPQWTVEQLPGGFELLESQPMTEHKNVLHLVYSDGLASVSVFVERAKPEGEAFVVLSRMGAVNAYGSVEDGYQVTVVGEVPEITVKSMGRSIKRKGQTQ